MDGGTATPPRPPPPPLPPQLASHPELYAVFIPGDYTAYVASMAAPAAWGDHVTLQAAADALGARVVVVSTYEPDPVIDIVPHGWVDGEGKGGGGPLRTLCVAFFAEVHYNSVLPAAAPGDEGGGGGPAASPGTGTPERVRRWFASNFGGGG